QSDNHHQDGGQATRPYDAADVTHRSASVAVTLLDMVTLAAHAVFDQVDALGAKSRMEIVTDVAPAASALAVVNVVREWGSRPLIGPYRGAADVADSL